MAASTAVPRLQPRLSVLLRVARQGFAAPGWRPPLTRLGLVASPKEILDIGYRVLNMSGGRCAQFRIGDAVIRPSCQNRCTNFVTALKNPPASLRRFAC